MTEPLAGHRYAHLRADDPNRFGADLVALLDAIQDSGGMLLHLSTQVLSDADAPGVLLFVGQVVYRAGLGEAEAVASAAATAEPQPGIEEQVAAIIDGSG